MINYVLSIKTAIAVLITTLLAVNVSLADPAPEAVAKTILDNLKKSQQGLKYGAVTTSPIKGIYKVQVNGSQYFYANETGEYVVAGDMYHARPGAFVPIKDKDAANRNKAALSTVADKDAIVFPAKGKRKAYMYVFTDVDCGYCRKLHVEALPTLNEKGVEVRYLAFPRAGIGSDSYRRIASAWCAKDKQAAMTKLKTGKPLKENVCKDNPVKAQFELGHSIGVNGTPALVLEDGTMVPGFRPAEELLAMMGISE